MYKWNQLGEGLVSAPLTDVPGVSFDISIALTSHFYTWTRFPDKTIFLFKTTVLTKLNCL